jgi:replicative DNA helicase
MLFDSDGARVAAMDLSADDFFSPVHRIYFEAFLDLFNRSQIIDYITAKNKLEQMNMLEQVGGADHLAQLSALVSTSANVKAYVSIVKTKAMLRSAVKAAGKMSELAYNEADIDEIIATAEQDILNISQNRKSEDFTHIQDVVASVSDKIDKINLNNDKVTGIKTGFIDFDNKTAGLQPSDLILIAARPSMGKTAFALNIAQYAAVEGGVVTAIFSLEMSKDQLVNRMLSAEARVDSSKLRSGGLDSDDFARIGYAMGRLSSAPVYIDDTAGISPTELRVKCRKLKQEVGLGLIVIDYLQLMNGSTGRKSDSAQQEVAFISKSLKAIARELNVPVIALSQLSRGVESRNDKRPMLSDLRDSGAIEQDADVVCFLYRDEYYNPETEKKNQGEVIIAKQRNGPVGSIDLVWQGQFTKFDNMLKEYDEAFVEAD